MKVIFLDIDGVLNVIPKGHDEFGAIFHAHFVENLKSIIDTTGAKIVVSSSWRMSGFTPMKNMWTKRGLPGEVIDVTPTVDEVLEYERADYYDAINRGAEIQMWLDNNKADAFVILDDDDDMLQSQKNQFVKCSGNKHHSDCVDIGYGLTKECAEKAIEILLK